MFKKIAVVGTGLIGGSLALAIKKKKLAKEVIGVSKHKRSLLVAKRMRAIDKGSLSLEVIREADLVILATPVDLILSQAKKISSLIGKECIVADVGSTKALIVRCLEKNFPNYLGTHPIAGSEKRGIDNASAELFKGCLCIFTPTAKTNKKTISKLDFFWKKLGAKTITLSPTKHDTILSSVSHLPHLAAFSLINSVPYRYLKFASSGLKDTTRLAGSDARLWSSIFLSNRQNILKSLENFQKCLLGISSALKAKNKKSLVRIIQSAKNKRLALEKILNLVE
jgi:prephenate dehydrogenase